MSITRKLGMRMRRMKMGVSMKVRRVRMMIMREWSEEGRQGRRAGFFLSFGVRGFIVSRIA
jgi:hypothetical protein